MGEGGKKPDNLKKNLCEHGENIPKIGIEGEDVHYIDKDYIAIVEHPFIQCADLSTKCGNKTSVTSLYCFFPLSV